MISLAQIKKLLEKSDNPLIFYDNDGDGLVSYCLIRRKYNKVRGVVVKGSLDLDGPYLKKIEDYKPDLVIILDKPTLEQEFVDNVNVPVIWIDHHPIVKLKGIKYFNPLFKDKKDNRPVSYWCYKLVNRDLWLAGAGVIGDWNLALFDKVKKKYPNLFKCKVTNPGDVIYNCRFGELIRIINFLLKDRVSEVRKNADVLCKIKDPYEILDKKSSKGRYIFKQAEKIKKEYDNLIKIALKVNKRSKLLVFKHYNSNISLIGDLANELIHRYPKKVVVVAREKDDEMKISLRSGDKSKVILPSIIKKVLEEINNSYGGGHEHACGATVPKEDWNKFLEILRKNI